MRDVSFTGSAIAGSSSSVICSSRSDLSPPQAPASNSVCKLEFGSEKRTYILGVCRLTCFWIALETVRGTTETQRHRHPYSDASSNHRENQSSARPYAASRNHGSP